MTTKYNLNREKTIT